MSAECAARPRRIVLTGTFDVRNYGDLLFPLIADHHLRAHGLQLIAASPTARDTGWRDAMPPVALHEALGQTFPFDGVLIGGGNIIHARPVTLPDYVTAGVADHAYADLWLGASQAAAQRNVPVAWNAPGVPHAFTEAERPAVEATLRTAAYLAVRDAASAAFLGWEAAHIVPDTALGLADLWPRSTLEPDFRHMLQRLGPVPAGPYIAVHVKERSLDRPLGELALQLKVMQLATGLTPIIIGIGACHGDDQVAAALSQEMPGQCIDLAHPLGLREIAAAIALSDVYVGASMHGYVTAAAYGRPAVIVGRPRLPKMSGLLAQTGRPQDEADGWSAAFGQVQHRQGHAPPDLPLCVAEALKKHWNEVATTLMPQGSQRSGAMAPQGPDSLMFKARR